MPAAAGVVRRQMRWTSMDRSLFKSLSGQQTQPSKELTMDACRSKAWPKKQSVDARLFLQMTASTQVSTSTDTAGCVQCSATTAKPAAPVPWLASDDLSPFAVGKGQSCWPYQREIVRLYPNPSPSFVECVEGLVLSAGRAASTTTNEYNAPAD